MQLSRIKKVSEILLLLCQHAVGIHVDRGLPVKESCVKNSSENCKNSRNNKNSGASEMSEIETTSIEINIHELDQFFVDFFKSDFAGFLLKEKGYTRDEIKDAFVEFLRLATLEVDPDDSRLSNIRETKPNETAVRVLHDLEKVRLDAQSQKYIQTLFNIYDPEVMERLMEFILMSPERSFNLRKLYPLVKSIIPEEKTPPYRKQKKPASREKLHSIH